MTNMKVVCGMCCMFQVSISSEHVVALAPLLTEVLWTSYSMYSNLIPRPDFEWSWEWVCTHGVNMLWGLVVMRSMLTRSSATRSTLMRSLPQDELNFVLTTQTHVLKLKSSSIFYDIALMLYCPYLNCSNSAEIRFPFSINLFFWEGALPPSSSCSSFISEVALRTRPCETHMSRTLYLLSLHESYNICTLHLASPFLLCGFQWTLPWYAG